MKWFKHQSNARNDERLAHLEDKCGLEGYGFYFKMLEIVAEVIDQSDKHEVIYSMSRWGRQVNVTSKKFLFLSQCCADVGLMLVQRDADNITIKIPNLLKYRDNHTKNLQATSKQELETETDKEADKEVEKPTPKPTAKASAEILPIPDLVSEELWSAYLDVRKGLKAKNTLPAIRALINQLKKLTGEGNDPAEVVNQSIRSSWKDLYAVKKQHNAAPPGNKPQHQKRTETAQAMFGELANGNNQSRIIDISPSDYTQGDRPLISQNG